MVAKFSRGSTPGPPSFLRLASLAFGLDPVKIFSGSAPENSEYNSKPQSQKIPSEGIPQSQKFSSKRIPQSQNFQAKNYPKLAHISVLPIVKYPPPLGILLSSEKKYFLKYYSVYRRSGKKDVVRALGNRKI